MSAVLRGIASWLSATRDTVLSVVAFWIIWYPLISVGNALVGSPVPTGLVDLIVGVLAIGGAYPVVAGEWSLRRIGEYVFYLLASALGWAFLGMMILLVMGTSFSGSDSTPQAVLWAIAYLTAYVIVYRPQLPTDVSRPL